MLPYINDFDEGRVVFFVDGINLVVQKELLELDEECANRQIEIQREFDRRKQPHFKKRQVCVL